MEMAMAMALALALSEAWIGLIGALGGVALTGVIGLMTAIFTQRWTLKSARVQRRDDLLSKRAELRRDAYARLLLAADLVLSAYDSWAPADRSLGKDELIDELYRSQPEPRNEYAAAYNHARLLAGESVAQAIAAFTDWVNGWEYQFARQWSQEEGTEVDYDAFAVSTLDAEGNLIAAIRAEQQADLMEG